MASLLNKSDVLRNNSVRILATDADYAAIELFKGYPDGLLKFASVCCVISMIIGIPGNIITIVALARYKRSLFSSIVGHRPPHVFATVPDVGQASFMYGEYMKEACKLGDVLNATAIFIMNLSCADLLFCCITPSLTAATIWNRSWMHGRLFCRLFPPARYTLIAVSIFTICAITINRYIIIIYPRIYRKVYKNRNLAIMLAAIWISPLLALIPTFLGKWGRFDLDPLNGSCTIVPDENKRSSKQFLFIASFGLPCIPIFFCYARIFLIVRKATQNSQNSNANKTKSSPSSSNQETGDSSSITVRVTGTGNESHENGNGIPLKYIENSKTETPNETSDNDVVILELSDPPKIRRNLFKRSIAMLKVTLPTRKDKRLGTMIAAIMTSFCVCHLPIVLTKVIRWITPHPAVNIAAHILLYFSSCINPVIYVVMSNEYQKAYRNLFNCRKKRTLL